VGSTGHNVSRYVVCSLLHSSVTLSLLDPDVSLNTLFSNALSPRSSLNVEDQVSHPYKTTGKITVLYYPKCKNKTTFKMNEAIVWKENKLMEDSADNMRGKLRGEIDK